jgi:hypothetical protein
MQLTNIGKNQTLITHKIYHTVSDFCSDYDVYYSYSQPVVIVDWNVKRVYQNLTSYSNTTSKHTNQYLRMSNRFDYDNMPKGRIIDGWQHSFVNEAKINTLANGAYESND